jgi:hypothetical protein
MQLKMLRGSHATELEMGIEVLSCSGTNKTERTYILKGALFFGEREKLGEKTLTSLNLSQTLIY